MIAAGYSRRLRELPPQPTARFVMMGLLALTGIASACAVNVEEISCVADNECDEGRRCSRGRCIRLGGEDGGQDTGGDATDANGGDTTGTDFGFDIMGDVFDELVPDLPFDIFEDTPNEDTRADLAEEDVEVVFPLDPAPSASAAGEYHCEGGPNSDLGGPFDRLKPSWSIAELFQGTVENANGNGIWYVRGTQGEDLRGTVVLADDGDFYQYVPLYCGDNLVKFVFTNDSCSYVVVYEVQNATGSACDPADIQVFLWWDENGVDWELHLVEPDGRLNDEETDCQSRNCVGGTSVDWGTPGDSTDNPNKDRDDTGDQGTETITLNLPIGGQYRVMVEHFSPEGSNFSDGMVIMAVGGEVYFNEILDLEPHFVWTAARINWPGGVAVSDETVDCDDQWGANGCLIELE